MRLHLLKSGPLLALGSLLLFAGAAQAGPIDSASSGLDQAQGCGDPPCAFDVIYNLDASAPVTGDLEITGSTLDFTISLASATLSGSDGAVSSIDFTGVTYSGSFAITLDGSGGATITDQIVTNGMGRHLQRYSPLDTLNKANVKNLVPAWAFSLGGEK